MITIQTSAGNKNFADMQEIADYIESLPSTGTMYGEITTSSDTASYALTNPTDVNVMRVTLAGTDPTLLLSLTGKASAKPVVVLGQIFNTRGVEVTVTMEWDLDGGGSTNIAFPTIPALGGIFFSLTTSAGGNNSQLTISGIPQSPTYTWSTAVWP